MHHLGSEPVLKIIKSRNPLALLIFHPIVIFINSSAKIDTLFVKQDSSIFQIMDSFKVQNLEEIIRNLEYTVSWH